MTATGFTDIPIVENFYSFIYFLSMRKTKKIIFLLKHSPFATLERFSVLIIISEPSPSSPNEYEDVHKGQTEKDNFYDSKLFHKHNYCFENFSFFHIFSTNEERKSFFGEALPIATLEKFLVLIVISEPSPIATLENVLTSVFDTAMSFSQR